MTAADQDWNAWFKREGVTPLRITYDELSRDPPVILSGILDALDLDKSVADGIAPPTTKLSDDINRSWAERFRIENTG